MKEWTYCPGCGTDHIGWHRCPAVPPLRLTQHGRDVVATAALVAALLLTLALASGVDRWIR